METAPGRKRRWLLASDVAEGSQNGLPLEVSSFAVKQGWTGIERTSVESMGPAELEGVLQKYFYDESFRRLLNEPLLYGVVAWVIVAYLAFMMREDIGYEWRQLRRAVTEPQRSSNSGEDWAENREGIVSRIRSRFAHWKSPNPESLRGSYRPASTGVQGEVSTAHQLANPLPPPSPQPPSQRRAIFPGSSPSNAAHSKSEP